jgi:hypothetical protein
LGPTAEPPPRDRVVCEARRIWSHLLIPWPPATPPGLSTATRHEGAGLSLYYQYCDYAALPNRPPGLAPAHAEPPARDRVVCEARRIWSRLLIPWPPATPPGLSTTTRHEGPDSPYTINTAAMQPCRIDPLGSSHSRASRRRDLSHTLTPQWLAPALHAAICPRRRKSASRKVRNGRRSPRAP